MPNEKSNKHLSSQLAAAKSRLRAPRPARTKRAPRVGSRATSTARNDYLASLLDPWNGKGVGVPDFSTSKVLTVQTKQRKIITVDGAGNYGIIFRPGVQGAMQSIGMNAAGNDWHSMRAGSFNLPGAYSASTVLNGLTATDYTLFQADFEQVRPVSFGAKWIPTQAALTMQGMIHVVDHVPGDSLPIPMSIAAFQATGIESVLAPVANPQNLAAYSTIGDFAASCDHTNSMSKELCTSWTPDLPDNLNWRGLGANANYAPPATAVHNYDWTNGGLDQYYLPFEFDRTLTPNNVIAYNRLDQDPFSSFIWVWEGATANAVVGEVEITINWEVQVRPGLSSILPTRVVPSNPDEFSQASNVIQQVPTSYYPGDLSEPTTMLRTHILDTAKHLYDGQTPKKEAVEGTSIWSKIKSIGGRILGAAAPFLTMIPGVGAALGPGAAFLSSVLAK